MISVLAKLWIKDNGDVKNPRVREAYGVLCGSVGIFLNICLFAGKFLAGLFSGSIAITADAFNNLSDAGSSVITLIGFKIAGQKPDSDHPFGHGRIEYLSGFLVSVVILIMAFELLKSSVQKIFHPEPIDTGVLVMVVLVVSILVKIYMCIYNKSVAKKIDSAAMDATAMDSLSDSVATTVVLLSTLIAHFFDVQIDGYCGVIVALFVAVTGFQAAKETIDPLLGQPPEPEFVNQIQNIVMSYQDQGVLGFHDLVVHNYGPGRVMLSVHVEVPANGDILHMHDMIDNIEHRLHRELNCSAVIHMDPICVGDERTNELKEKVAAIIDGMEEDIHFHDFRIVDGPTHTNVIFDVEVPYSVKTEDKDIVSYLQKKIRELGSNGQKYYAVIDVDREYVPKSVSCHSSKKSV